MLFLTDFRWVRVWEGEVKTYIEVEVWSAIVCGCTGSSAERKGLEPTAVGGWVSGRKERRMGRG